MASRHRWLQVEPLAFDKANAAHPSEHDPLYAWWQAVMYGNAP